MDPQNRVVNATKLARQHSPKSKAPENMSSLYVEEAHPETFYQRYGMGSYKFGIAENRQIT